MNPRHALTRLIPLTSLRHFYHLLRSFEREAYHLETLRECLRRTDKLQGMIQSSFDHFKLYDNHTEGFRPIGGVLTEARLQNPDIANQLLVAISKGDVTTPSNPTLEFDFVDCDISPHRTTSSHYEDGRSGRAAGIGGVDVLLSSRLDRLPCIGEIKAQTDRNPFLGFIQSLTYAVELSTSFQRTRLDLSYPGRFSWPENGPWIDICLLLIRYPVDDANAEFLEMTGRLAEKLMVPGTPAARLIRRVSCLLTDFDQQDIVNFKPAFLYGA